MTEFTTRAGRAFPLGASVAADGVNFSVFSRNSTRAELLLFGNDADRDPIAVLELDPVSHRAHHCWHVFVEGLTPRYQYTWRVDGPKGDAQNGFRFDRQRQLLDPWARDVSLTHWNRERSLGEEYADTAMRAIVVDDQYDWEGDAPLNLSLAEAVIYELHPRGFTRHPTSGVNAPGTFAGLVEKIPYLQSLGITHVELLPVFLFDPDDVPNSTAEIGLSNYWGYSPCAFMALHSGYASGEDAAVEFRDMVKALHRAGIGVILDVVYNHTGEGGEDGPVINFKGLANEMYYHLEASNGMHYRDYTGCGNTINANHPVVAQLLQQSVEYWVTQMHVDGFRFDLASALARGERGEVLQHAPVLWNIASSSALAETHLIAEAWDATGMSHRGNFPGLRWVEWNGDYRDVVRRFLRGDPGLIGELASRITGSSDLFGGSGALPTSSINFVTCHDGFTLADLVSYAQKHNENNGEDNRDGSDCNHSSNWGVEGATDDPDILRIRRQQAKNHIMLLMLSQGVPMLLGGDEMLRTQDGNNNAWCQDNGIGWLDWSLADTNADIVRFTREAIALRKRHPAMRRTRYTTGEAGPETLGLPDISWHGAHLSEPDWDDPAGRELAFTLAPAATDEPPVHVVLNMAAATSMRQLPELDGLIWRRVVDTSLDSPEDFVAANAANPVEANRYPVQSYSIAVFEAYGD